MRHVWKATARAWGTPVAGVMEGEAAWFWGRVFITRVVLWRRLDNVPKSLIYSFEGHCDLLIISFQFKLTRATDTGYML